MTSEDTPRSSNFKPHNLPSVDRDETPSHNNDLRKSVPRGRGRRNFYPRYSYQRNTKYSDGGFDATGESSFNGHHGNRSSHRENTVERAYNVNDSGTYVAPNNSQFNSRGAVPKPRYQYPRDNGNNNGYEYDRNYYAGWQARNYAARDDSQNQNSGNGGRFQRNWNPHRGRRVFNKMPQSAKHYPTRTNNFDDKPNDASKVESTRVDGLQASSASNSNVDNNSLCSASDEKSQHASKERGKDRNKSFFNNSSLSYNMMESRQKQKDNRFGDNYRGRDKGARSYSPKFKNYEQKTKQDISQRDRLIEQLAKNACECTVCCDRIRAQDSVWSCQNCHHIFHLKCIRKWAKSPSAVVEGSGWRCPTCQHLTEKVPYHYYCFCGKARDPEWNHYDIAHSCGETCGKSRSNTKCVHRCMILCHPGPCPPCQIQIHRHCECGKETKLVFCGFAAPILCGRPCDKLLNCGIHRCDKLCHESSCEPCQKTVLQNCHCGKETKEVQCTVEAARNMSFSCGSVCDTLLNCKNHRCLSICHEGQCEECNLTPDKVKFCPCGKMPLNGVQHKRTSCLDPIPNCDNICDKVLLCSSGDNVHRCVSTCHEGDCPPCLLKSSVKCRCGFLSQEVECAKLKELGEIVCNKRCNKKLQCGRHKCLRYCCIESVHPCELICKRKLSCGLHNCEELCHRGNCPPCWRTSFEELPCHCGYTVLFPPIACGTKPPECSQPCARTHNCTHDVTHQCHNDEKCPPCTFLTEKWCYGNHELRSNVPCYLKEICCGRPCGKLLLCGIHKCLLTCHASDCVVGNDPCKQPCLIPRPSCGHPCGAPCHPSKPCPDKSCKAKVLVHCLCGNLTEEISCAENMQALLQQTTSAMASKLSELQAGHTVDITDVFKPTAVKCKRLDCNSDCAMIERNRRLALALQIRNPELTNKLGPPAYTDFLKDHMKQNAALVASVYNKLTELVQMAKQSKQKSRSHAFPPMNREHRRVVHELAEYFGCETCSYDEEPKKNVVATALRDKSWLPSVSLMVVIERESLPRKAPPPIPHNKTQPLSKSELTENKLNAATTSTLSKATEDDTPKPPKTKEVIDYFDYNPE